MSAAIAKKCGLYVPIVNMTPTGLVEFLALYNTYTHYASTFLLPYPWMPPPPPPLPGEPRMRPMKELMKSDVKWG
jgi:hypothetical protein